MERLTKREYIANQYRVVYETHNVDRAIYRLGQYEDIDEELGIEYPVLVNALKHGFVDNKNKYHHFSNLYFNREEIFDGHEKESFLLKDYGKTWTLTKRY